MRLDRAMHNVDGQRLLKVHKHEIILNFFFDLNQILIRPS